MRRFLPFYVLAVISSGFLAWGDEPHASTAFPPADPQFSRHVIPLFSRLGCNAGTCHGKVKGENGFRLSLFGVAPQEDYASLLREHAGRRVNLTNVDASLLLAKPIGAVSHGGGKLMEPGGPEHQILRRWLENGAPLDPLEKSQIVRLTVSPAEQTIQIGENYHLHVEAEFSDGSKEDVTSLCRFEPATDAVVKVDNAGVVTAEGIGDAAIVVRYGAEPAVAMVVVPGPAIDFPAALANNFIDEHIFAKLRLLNVPPANVCSDEEFLRRASLDISGELPKPEEVRDFLAAGDAHKRAKKIDELLKRPGHAALWATKFCDILRPSDFDGNYGMIEPAENRRFYDWVRARLEENVPYDEFAERILTATSRDERPYEVWIEEVLQMAEENSRESADLPVYAQRKTLDLYWQRKDATGVSGTVQVAHAFLGLRMECAQCHRHPHDVWSQDDLLSFANFFNQLKGARYPDKKEMPEAIAKMFEELPKEAKKLEEPLKELRDKKLREVNGRITKSRDELNRANSQGDDKKDQGQIKQLEEQLATQEAEKSKLEQEIADLEAQRRRMTDGPKRFGTNIRHDSEKVSHASMSSPLGSQRSEKFRLLGEAEPVEVDKEQDPRELVVEWMKRPDNPLFARAIVNRVWAHYFGRGIVDPPDQLSPLNPASHPQLLDELAQKFIENKYDLRWLHRTIAASGAYQLSSAAPIAPGEPGSEAAQRNFAYFQLRRLPAEVLVDAVNQATGSVEVYPSKLYLAENAKAIEVAGVTSRENQEAELAYAFKIFGRPLRNTDVQCDCERDTNATIVQTLYLANHPRVREKIYSEEGRVARILAEISDDAGRIEEIYLATLGRLPSDSERQSCLSYVQQRESSLRSFQDVLWSLLNTREFILNH